MRFGTATAAKMPMIATAIINSIKLKPSLRCRLLCISLNTVSSCRLLCTSRFNCPRLKTCLERGRQWDANPTAHYGPYVKNRYAEPLPHLHAGPLESIKRLLAAMSFLKPLAEPLSIHRNFITYHSTWNYSCNYNRVVRIRGSIVSILDSVVCNAARFNSDFR